MSRNAALLLAARITSALTTLAVLSFVARLRGPEELGLVAVGLAGGAILATSSDVGLGPLLVRRHGGMRRTAPSASPSQAGRAALGPSAATPDGTIVAGGSTRAVRAAIVRPSCWGKGEERAR